MKCVSKHILWFIAPLMACSGCDSSNPSSNDKYMVLNMVTYQGTSHDGVTTMTFQEINDSPLLTLTCDWTPNPDLVSGTRLIILYHTESPLQSGHITLSQAARTYGGKLKQSAQADTLSLNPVYLNSIWRSGTYLNLDLKMQYTSGQRVVNMVVDYSTIGTACPVLYLEVDKSTDENAVFNRQAYASWDVSDIWLRPEVNALKVKIKDVRLDIDEWIISK